MPPVPYPYFAAQLRQARSIPSTVWARAGSIAAKKAVTIASRKSRRIVSSSVLYLPWATCSRFSRERLHCETPKQANQ